MPLNRLPLGCTEPCRRLRDKAFAEACERLRPTIKGFEHGIGRYGDSQKEVILDAEYVPIGAILALGGYSSDLPTIAAKYSADP